MAEHFGLSVLAWGPLGAGVLTGKYTRAGVENDSRRVQGNEARGRTGGRALEIARTVDAVADERGVTSAQVAVAWVAAQGYRYLPIVGARKVSQLEDSLGGASLKLGEGELERLAAASGIEPGFPHDFLSSDGVRDLVRGEIRPRIDGRAARR
jgi:aryl-alcohol dehydrogenase-like predicted oxidoreductase